MLLNNGLKFVPTPRRLTRQQLEAAINRFERSVRLRCLFQDTGLCPLYRVPNPAFVPPPAPAVVEAFLSMVKSACLTRFDSVEQQPPPRPNLTSAQRLALRTLRDNKSCVIKAADKNLGLTIMSADAYHAAVVSVVSDHTVYEDVTNTLSDVISSTRRSLSHLAALYDGCLGQELREFLLQGLNNTTVPSLYILPKLHKMRSLDSPLVGRPIAACHSWITTNASIWLADELNKCLKDYPEVLVDRTQFVRELEGLTVSEDAWLLTFDVESLYPHVEHEGCLDACAEAVRGDPYKKTMIRDMLAFVLKNNVVSVQGRQYRQRFGGAMGTNCMPPAAQIYLARKWESLAKQKLGVAFPKMFRRYIDDGFVVFEGSERELLSFLDLLGNLLPNIKITHSYSRFQVDFLDLVVFKCMEDALTSPDGRVRLKVRTHQKVLNKYLYIPYSSFHHQGMFKSFINAELIRYVVTNSDQHWFDCMVRKFTHRLRQRGYPLTLVASIASRVSYSKRQRYLSASADSAQRNSKSALVVPYAQQVPDLRLQQLVADEYVKGGEALHAAISRPIVAFSKNRSLGSMLVKASN